MRYSLNKLYSKHLSRLRGICGPGKMVPKLDRMLKGPKNRYKGKPLATLVASAFVIGLIAIMFITPTTSEGNPPAPNIPARIAYSLHDPIYIDGNAQFCNTLYPNNGVVSGNGTASDPYIIEDWDINASSSAGIYIRHTNAYFIVRDCCVHDRTNFSVIIDNCVNGALINNNCSNCYYGIALWSSSNNNTLSNNNCSSNDNHGIHLWGPCSNNTLGNNTCISNGEDGIYLSYEADNNTLINNTCNSNNEHGIWLWSSSNNTLGNNTCSGNNQFGIYFSECNDNDAYFNICQNNSLSGIALVKSNNSNVSGNLCSGGNYGIGLGFSNNSILSNNICSNNIKGITVEYPSRENVFSNNTLINNTAAIYLNGAIDFKIMNNSGTEGMVFIMAYNASHCAISNNNCSSNTVYGIYLNSSSNNNTIWNNTFSGNNGGGIQAYDDGMNNSWNTSGSPHGYGNYWSDLTTPDGNGDGIVDWSYNLTGSAGAKDWYPLTNIPFIPELSDMLIPIAGLMLIALAFGRARKKP
jgi:parallel beta-helix repeat protein